MCHEQEAVKEFLKPIRKSNSSWGDICELGCFVSVDMQMKIALQEQVWACCPASDEIGSATRKMESQCLESAVNGMIYDDVILVFLFIVLDIHTKLASCIDDYTSGSSCMPHGCMIPADPHLQTLTQWLAWPIVICRCRGKFCSRIFQSRCSIASTLQVCIKRGLLMNWAVLSWQLLDWAWTALVLISGAHCIQVMLGATWWEVMSACPNLAYS